MLDNSDLMSRRVFRLSPQVVMEEFDDGVLLLRLENRRLLELRSPVHQVVVLTNGERTVAQVAVAMAQTSRVSESGALGSTIALYEQLCAQGFIESVGTNQDRKENNTMENTSTVISRYARNPDVALREEDAEGGLLFNPDSNQVRVVNASGLFIWRQCDGTRDLAAITSAVQEAFDEAPPEQVALDVREFVEEMVKSGFIGVVQPQ